MLTMHFLGPGDEAEYELRIDPPHENVVSFIGAEINHNVDLAQAWIADLRKALRGDRVASMGNVFYVEADARMAKLTNEFVGPPDLVIEVPTPWLLDAIERWHAYLVSRGFKPHELAD